MNKKQIKKIIVKIIVSNFGIVGQIKRSTKFIDDLGFDSLDIAEFLSIVEFEFDCINQITDEEEKQIKTVGCIVDYIIRRGLVYRGE